MLAFKRGFHNTVNTAARTRYTKPKPKHVPKVIAPPPSQVTHHYNNLKITAPVPPVVQNIVCPDDHPLWQFFADKKFMRSPSDVDSTSRAWSIPELRRKSFDDLHSLWYICLKERNILARENHLLRNIVNGNQGTFEDVSEKIRTTMWRIRHVLSERDWAFKNAQLAFENERANFIKEFETDFLKMTQEEDEVAFESLARFQKSIFGISEYLDENVVDRTFVDGLKIVANLKLQKFAPREEAIRKFIDALENNRLDDVGEAFVIFTAENGAKDVKDACDAVLDLRDSNNKIARIDEINTVSQYIKSLAEVQKQPEVENENESQTF
ncbi:hypothetical protein TPHA_0B00520 [Tetrapisispora phaffii CBS 4417]|uniref:Large ribosomal subunit protein uL29m n=1 Tax=Tetrapisispora phaffii (strain ATCC 24235 / CBS 4417 / NBRC 1672 / NRRL Y-8282 / UCD 70-5) TaxID=1071381 RepID=G8BQC7_TETPH|nr:mitochondrial 54S ribosomal protein YmL4 TPHA_0B00520 [Tetrapisispora phaffii CBS 4417]CCE61724.1 hypothetical protein TPHA_0B00520 [Tetrapisispora phaffii CBS 4417]